MTRAFDAIVQPGLENVLAEELKGYSDAPPDVQGGVVRFGADDAGLVRALLSTRVATRILEVVAERKCRSFPDLEKFITGIDLRRYLPSGSPIRVEVSSSKSRLYHTDGIAERVVRDLKHPEGDRATATTIYVRVVSDMVRLSVDAAGERLHRRGYRLEGGRAPLRETLAAGILLSLGWTGKTSLVDPMCGSGTFPIEAAWIASGRAPGLDRPIACETWPGLKADVKAIRQSLKSRQHKGTLPAIVGTDRDSKAVDLARQNGERAGVTVEWAVSNARDIGPGDLPPGLVIANLPYGKRIEGPNPAFEALEALAQRFEGWQIAALWGTPGPHPTGWTERLKVANGGIPLRVLVRDAA